MQLRELLMPVELVTIAAYARHRGCDEKAVRKALSEGRISRIGTERKCIDPAVADVQWAANTRARVSVREAGRAGAGADAPGADAGGKTVPSLLDHRLRRERAEADMAEHEAKRKAGQLMRVEPAERAVFDAFRELRDATFAAIRSASPMVIGLTEVREVQHLLEDALRTGYADFEVRMRRRLAESQAA